MRQKHGTAEPPNPNFGKGCRTKYWAGHDAGATAVSATHLSPTWSGPRVSQETASGILIAALGALEMHFDTKKGCDNGIF